MTKALFNSVPFFPTEVIKVIAKHPNRVGRVVSSGCLPMVMTLWALTPGVRERCPGAARPSLRGAGGASASGVV